MSFIRSFSVMIAISLLSCKSDSNQQTSKIKLVTLDPGHFHAALVQKTMYEDVDSIVHVYAPESYDVHFHLDRINAYNTASEKPTHWKEQIYLGENFLEKMIAQKKGNVVVIAGNNKNKTEYIKKSVDAGFNVLADKPMAINAKAFNLLKASFESATEKNVLLYDIMTERYEITNMLQRELALIPEIFGSLEKGTSENPAIKMESVHYFFKKVSGNVLTRPSWFMDVAQQGDGIADVAVHLVDLVQWGFFPGQTLDYTKDIQIHSARRWSTDLSLEQFTAITKQSAFPHYFKKDLKDSTLQVYANGEINYQLKGVYNKVIVKWDYTAANGSGDTHESVVRGTKANLVIRQGASQSYKPALYIEPVANNSGYAGQVKTAFKKISEKYPGVALREKDLGWEVIVPEKYKVGHEAHFAQVTENFLKFLKEGNMPVWEIPNMLAKYYTTTQALELAKKTAHMKME